MTGVTSVRDVAIVGAGPAGVAAAGQLCRYGVRPVVFETGVVGGLLRTAWWVENHPGFPRGIRGPDLAALLSEHLAVSCAELRRAEVTSVDWGDGVFAVRAGDTELLFRRVVVATGTRPKRLKEPGVPSGLEGNVYYEARELWGTSETRIAILGGGDAAFDYAIGLSESNDVTILMRGESPRGLRLLQSRARASDRVTIRAETSITRIEVGPGGGLMLVLRGTQESSSGAGEVLGFDRLLVAIGREPEDGFLTETVRSASPELSERGLLLFAGDVRSGIFRQSSIAAGQGTLAAMRIASELENTENTFESGR